MFRFFKTLKPSFILLAVVILLIFLHYVGVLRPIESIVVKIFSPVQHQIYSLGTRINGLYSHPGSANLAQDNEELKKEVNRLIVENVQLKTIIEENQQLLAERDFLESNGLQAITAKVIGQNPQANLQALILDKGSKDGVTLDLPLITSGGVMVGKISKVNRSYSEAILINDSQSSVAVMIQNEDNSKGVLVGEHGLSLKMELIPQNEIVKQNDLVITSGLEPNIPRGLVIGKVSRVATEPNSAFQTAWLQSLVRVDNLLIVSVLKNSNYDKDSN